MSTPAELLAQSLAKLRTAKRVSGSSASYRKDNPTEYNKVIAYLDGGARPSGVTTDMGMGLLLEEDARRALAVTPPPPDPAGIGLGSQFHGNWSAYTNGDRLIVLDKLAAAGAEWVRLDTAWAGIETSKGARAGNLALVDFNVNEAAKRGLKVLMTLWLTPGWANGGRGEKVPPDNPQDYADFARWAAGYWRGKVQAYEVWNEPDPSQSFWQGTIPQLVALMKAGYTAYKSVDPSLTVVFPACANNQDVWLDQVYAAGAKGSFDVMGTHPYPYGNKPPEAPDQGKYWFTHTPAMRAVMTKYGDSSDMWFTEFGWFYRPNNAGLPDWEWGVTLAEQADYLKRAVAYTKANYPYVKVMIWYKDRAWPGSTDVRMEGYGLLNADLSERPVYVALKNL